MKAHKNTQQPKSVTPNFNRPLPATDGDKYRRWIRPMNVQICAEHMGVYEAFKANFPIIERCARDDPYAIKTKYGYMRYRCPSGHFTTDPETWPYTDSGLLPIY